jgi:hypothetical protein
VLTLLKMLGYNVTSIKYGYGLSPVQGVPVAGWLDYGLPIVRRKAITRRRRTKQK